MVGEVQDVDELVEVVLKVLSKEPSQRFQDAEAMAQALRQVSAKLSANQARARCPSCGALNESQRAFCGDCGRRLSLGPGPITGIRSAPPPGERPLVGRTEVFERLLEVMRAAAGKFRTRFERVEALSIERGIDLHRAGLDALDALWDEVKRGE